MQDNLFLVFSKPPRPEILGNASRGLPLREKAQRVFETTTAQFLKRAPAA